MSLEAPIPILLFCPMCGTQHIDAEDATKSQDGLHIHNGILGVPHWANPPHRSHLCAQCGCIWRPADVATVGVASIETKGKADNFSPPVARELIQSYVVEYITNDETGPTLHRKSLEDWPHWALGLRKIIYGV